MSTFYSKVDTLKHSSFQSKVSEWKQLDLKRRQSKTLMISYLNEHKINHNFQDCKNPLYSCNCETESISHFLLHSHFSDIGPTLLNDLKSIYESMLSQENNRKVE